MGAYRNVFGIHQERIPAKCRSVYASVLCHSYRFQWTPWTTKMREDSLKALSALPGVAQVVMPQPSPDEKTLNAEKGLTPFGAVHDLDEAETVAEYFRQQKVRRRWCSARSTSATSGRRPDRGETRSACRCCSTPPRSRQGSPGPLWHGTSDSYCGNLSMASALYRRKIPFHYAGHLLPRRAGVRRGGGSVRPRGRGGQGPEGRPVGPGRRAPGHLRDGRLRRARAGAQVRPERDLRQPRRHRGQTRRYADDDPQVEETMASVQGEFPQITVARTIC